MCAASRDSGQFSCTSSSVETGEPLARGLSLVRQFREKGLARAADYFADRPAPSIGQTIDRRRSAIERLFPESECVEADCGGTCRIVRSSATTCGGRSAQGYVCPADAFGGPPEPEALARLTGDPGWADIDPANILYLDTETTSSTLSADTYTFLIGFGRFQKAENGCWEFCVEQFFMEDYADEGAVIETADRALAGAEALVSFNGIAYDVPLLECRWRLQRLRPRFPELHLDLLHYARRLWRLRLPDCSLGSVERHVLQIERVSDISGSWVPRAYYDFTRGVRPERIVPVFDHHAQDIYSLGALVSALLHAWHHPEDPRFAHAADQWGLARMHEQHGRASHAIARLEAAVLAARNEELGFRLAMRLARAYKKQGRLADAVAIWESRANQSAPGKIEPLLELAKHAEHKLKDYEQARKWAERALKILNEYWELMQIASETETFISGALARQIISLKKRRERLSSRHENVLAGLRKKRKRERFTSEMQ